MLQSKEKNIMKTEKNFKNEEIEFFLKGNENGPVKLKEPYEILLTGFWQSVFPGFENHFSNEINMADGDNDKTLIFFISNFVSCNILSGVHGFRHLNKFLWPNSDPSERKN